MNIKRIAVLTSGGDCSGMNAAIRGVVRAGMAAGVEVVGIQKGFQGLIDRHYALLDSRSVSNSLQRGGTFLQSARCKEMYDEPGQRLAAENLKGLGVDGLIVIGGDGSLRGAQALALKGTKVVALPASIDNDIPFTDMSLGVDTALNNIIYAVDCLKDTASSHDRAFVVETMGRNCGYLTVCATIACGAEAFIIPEVPFDMEQLCALLRGRFKEGRSNSIIMVAEGAGKAQEIADNLKDKIGFEVRVMILGHYQRGGSPSSFDRMLGARLGVAAVEALMSGESGKMIGLGGSDLQMTDLEQVLSSGLRPIDNKLLELSQALGQ